MGRQSASSSSIYIPKQNWNDLVRAYGSSFIKAKKGGAKVNSSSNRGYVTNVDNNGGGYFFAIRNTDMLNVLVSKARGINFNFGLTGKQCECQRSVRRFISGLSTSSFLNFLNTDIVYFIWINDWKNSNIISHTQSDVFDFNLKPDISPFLINCEWPNNSCINGNPRSLIYFERFTKRLIGGPKEIGASDSCYSQTDELVRLDGRFSPRTMPHPGHQQQ